MDIMLLCVNIGNSSISTAIFDDTGPVYSRKFPASGGQVDVAEVARELRDAARVQGFTVTGLAVASVVPDLSPQVCSSLEETFPGAGQAWQLSHESNLNFEITIPEPQELGADLIANAAAAAEFADGSAIVVDFGTALSFTVVEREENTSAAKAVLRGAVIFPGPVLALTSLFEGTALLPRLRPGLPEKAIGTTTEGAIHSGIFHGYKGAIQEIVAAIERELPPNTVRFLTGGSHEAYMEHLPGFDSSHKLLTLEGLRILYERASGSLTTKIT